ncbi:MAG: Transcriptional regulator, TetR family [Myxococcales bacterium]|nr:Transcriptional regulator, TetR family [Myxococcales bacterium]
MQAQTRSADDQAIRARLFEGMSAAIVEKGYAATTIADIARHARVSKRTIYEHFEDKEACFLALYAAASEEVIRLVFRAATPDLGWEAQIEIATHEYLSALQSQPELARTFLLEIQAAGPRAVRMRREIHREFAQMIMALVERGRAEAPEVAPLSLEMATAIVGGINELVLLALEEGRARRLLELRDTATEYVRKLLLPPRRRR